LRPVLEILRQHEVIFHGADYDLRLLRKTCGFVPSAIMDTMLASRLLGCREFGLTHLVSKFLGVPLEKGPQKANWARRPLTQLMEELAMAAVTSRNLHQILPRRFWPRRRERLLKAIAAGLASQDPPRILRPKSARQTEVEKRRMHELEKRRDRAAAELGIDATLIASRAMLVLLARDWATHAKDLMHWQRELLEPSEV